MLWQLLRKVGGQPMVLQKMPPKPQKYDPNNGVQQLSKHYLQSFTLSMDDSPTSRSRGRAPTFSFHDLDNPPLSSPSVGAAQPSSPSILLSPKRGNVRTSRTKNSPTRTQLTTAFANKGKFAHPKTEKVWKYPSATNQKAGEKTGRRRGG
jgi:hypothetical protein